MSNKIWAVLLPWALAAAAPLHAADGDYFSPTDERFRLSVGVLDVSTKTTFRADGSTGTLGTAVNGEEAFGLDRSDVEPKFQAVVRVATRHRLSFDYFTLDRSGHSTVGATPISFGDVILPSAAPLSSKMSLRTFGITYEYSFWHGEKLEVAATAGVHITDVSTQVRVQTSTMHLIQDEDEAGPVPTVGLDATWVISKRFYLDARGQYLDVHVNNLGGSLGFFYLDVLYRYRPNVALGVGYSQIRAKLTSARASHGGVFDFDTKGPELFVRVGF